MSVFLNKLFWSPLFYGAVYIALIPIFASIYRFVPAINESFNGGPLNFTQSIYFSSVTITTLGFGDIHPKMCESAAQIIVASEAVLGIITIGLFLNAAATSSYRARKKALDERIVSLIEWTTIYQLFVIQNGTLKRIPQPKIRNSELSESRIKENMQDVFYKSDIPSSSNTVGPAIAGHLTNIRDNINELLRHVEYLDPELIHIISTFNNNQPLERWLREYQAEPINTKFGKFDPHDRDISNYSKQFHEIHVTSLLLRKYREKKYQHHPDVIRSMLGDAISHQHDFSRGIKLAKRLYKYPNHAKDAYFLTIVACLGLKKFDHAKRALKNYTSIGPENSDFVKDQIGRHYKKIPACSLDKLFGQ